mgnify:CR=1 FL=1
MVEEKQKRKTKPLSISKQKAQLMAQIEAAKDAGDMEKYCVPPPLLRFLIPILLKCFHRKKELKKELKHLIELENEENARVLSWHQQGAKVSLADINKKNKTSNMIKVVEKVSLYQHTEVLADVLTNVSVLVFA